MQPDHERFHLGVFGGSGTGKTTYALRFITVAKARCVFLFDAEGEFARRLCLVPARLPQDIDAAVASGWVCYDPHVMFPGQMEEALVFFCRFVIAWCEKLEGRKFFVVDECQRYMTGNVVPPALKVLVQSGRRYGADGVFIGQQPNELHNTVRAQLSEVACFTLTDEQALKFPKRFGFDVAAVSRLDPKLHQWICRDNQGRETRG